MIFIFLMNLQTSKSVTSQINNYTFFTILGSIKIWSDSSTIYDKHF